MATQTAAVLLKPDVVLAVDPIALTVEGDTMRVVLWRRNREPFVDHWALPGVFYTPGEGLPGAAHRGLQAKAHVEPVDLLEQLFTWDHDDRDPRGRVITTAYYTLLEAGRLRAMLSVHDDVCLARIHVPWPGETGGRVQLYAEDTRVHVAFDHDEILGLTVKRLRGRLAFDGGLALRLLPSQFTLRQLQQVHEVILGRPLNKDSFRRSVTQTTKLVVPTGRYQAVAGRRVAELYRAAVGRGTP